MLRLWKIEWRKIQNYIVFWIMSGLYLLALSLVLFAAKSILDDSLGSASKTIPVLAFPYIWQNLTWFASFFDLILVMIIIIIVSNEYTYRTARQNVIDGLSRLEFLLSKILISTVISTLATILVFLLIIMIALYYGQDTSNFLENIEFVLAFWLQLFGYLSFGILVAVLLRRTGFAIVLFFIYHMMLEPFIVFVLPPPIEDYMPLKVIGDIVTSPLPQSLDDISNSQITEVRPIKIILGIVYIILFWIASFGLLKKRDL